MEQIVYRNWCIVLCSKNEAPWLLACLLCDSSSLCTCWMISGGLIFDSIYQERLSWLVTPSLWRVPYAGCDMMLVSLERMPPSSPPSPSCCSAVDVKVFLEHEVSRMPGIVIKYNIEVISLSPAWSVAWPSQMMMSAGWLWQESSTRKKGDSFLTNASSSMCRFSFYIIDLFSGCCWTVALDAWLTSCVKSLWAN